MSKLCFRTASVLLAALCVLCLSSCAIVEGIKREYEIKQSNRENATAFMELIKSGDKEGLLAEFSEKMLNAAGDVISGEIDELFSEVGEIVSYDDPQNWGYSQETVHSGEIVFYTSSPDVPDIRTADGRVLFMSFFITVINEDAPDEVGLNGINLYTGKGERGWLDEFIMSVDGRPDNKDDN